MNNYKTSPINPGTYHGIIRYVNEEPLVTKTGEHYTILKYGIAVDTDCGWYPVDFIFFKDNTPGSRYCDFFDALYEHFGSERINVMDHLGLEVIFSVSLIYSRGNEYPALNWYEPYEEYVEAFEEETSDTVCADYFESDYEDEPDLYLD